MLTESAVFLSRNIGYRKKKKVKKIAFTDIELAQDFGNQEQSWECLSPRLSWASWPVLIAVGRLLPVMTGHSQKAHYSPSLLEKRKKKSSLSNLATLALHSCSCVKTWKELREGADSRSLRGCGAGDGTLLFLDQQSRNASQKHFLFPMADVLWFPF